MKTLISALTAAALVAGIAAQAGAAPNGRDRNGNGNGARNSGPCVVTGWTDWALTRPIFKCPEDSAPVNGRRR